MKMTDDRAASTCNELLADGFTNWLQGKIEQLAFNKFKAAIDEQALADAKVMFDLAAEVTEIIRDAALSHESGK